MASDGRNGGCTYWDLKIQQMIKYENVYNRSFQLFVLAKYWCEIYKYASNRPIFIVLFSNWIDSYLAWYSFANRYQGDAMPRVFTIRGSLQFFFYYKAKIL